MRITGTITAMTTITAHAHVVMPGQTGGGWREQLGVVLAVGLRPCSGALIVLAFALSQGLLAAGIVAVLLMGLGTAITTGSLAALAVGAKGLARTTGGRRQSSDRRDPVVGRTARRRRRVRLRRRAAGGELLIKQLPPFR